MLHYDDKKRKHDCVYCSIITKAEHTIIKIKRPSSVMNAPRQLPSEAEDQTKLFGRPTDAHAYLPLLSIDVTKERGKR